MRGLEGTQVLISGGTRGIGFATAKRFLDEGSRVHLCGPLEAEVRAAVAALAADGEVAGSVCAMCPKSRQWRPW